jgi:TatD family-associated radical SAM protein
LRNNGDTAYGSDTLWLNREPEATEVIEQVDNLFFSECKSFVFCGYGEPTCRFSTLIETASLLKEKYPAIPIRLNTNGQSELINGIDSTDKLFGLIDSVSISLNSANEDDYDDLCHSVFGKKAFVAMLAFGEHCVGKIPSVQFSVVEETLSNENIEICKKIVENIGAKLRVRKFISENDKNPEIN